MHFSHDAFAMWEINLKVKQYELMPYSFSFCLHPSSSPTSVVSFWGILDCKLLRVGAVLCYFLCKCHAQQWS